MKTSALSTVEQQLSHLILKQQLPKSYKEDIEKYFIPIVKAINQLSIQQDFSIIGVNGAQGSGKSTCCLFLKTLLEIESLDTKNKHSVVIISIDDFYFTKKEREQLAQTIHPLFKTRGVPGTHDINLALKTFADLKNMTEGEHLLIPVFDKSTDDRKPKHQWTKITQRPSIILFEGWCIGATALAPDSLIKPINDLEQYQDAQQLWRNNWNQQLNNKYQQLFSLINWLLMLKIPDFEMVYQWRMLQEQKLQEQQPYQQNKQSLALLNQQQLQQFIQHYQRLTEHCLNTL
ncbi:MAG: hypothetical protein QM479_05595, partial [Pseudomonadota bacterium]